ncbi:MAG: photosynthetic complex putative assembly protein PuhB [Halorhodospira sp.]
MRTHEFEPIPGLPEEPPEGEEILWQGKPAWWSLTKRVLHVWLVAAYFLIVAAWFATSALLQGEGLAAAFGYASNQLLIGAIAVGLLIALGRWMANTTLYTITDHRVVMRIGASLPMTVNLPFARVEAASLGHHRDGTSDLTLRLFDTERVRYLLFWPHARPWRLSHPEPAMRAIPDGEKAAQILAEALESYRAHEEGRVGAASDVEGDTTVTAYARETS